MSSFLTLAVLTVLKMMTSIILLSLLTKSGEWKEQYMPLFYSLFIVPVGYSTYQDYYPHGGPAYSEEVSRNYDAYTAGLSEEEQLERALRASLWDRGRNFTPFSYFKACLT